MKLMITGVKSFSSSAILHAEHKLLFLLTTFDLIDYKYAKLILFKEWIETGSTMPFY